MVQCVERSIRVGHNVDGTLPLECSQQTEAERCSLEEFRAINMIAAMLCLAPIFIPWTNYSRAHSDNTYIPISAIQYNVVETGFSDYAITAERFAKVAFAYPHRMMVMEAVIRKPDHPHLRAMLLEGLFHAHSAMFEHVPTDLIFFFDGSVISISIVLYMLSCVAKHLGIARRNGYRLLKLSKSLVQALCYLMILEFYMTSIGEISNQAVQKLPFRNFQDLAALISNGDLKLAIDTLEDFRFSAINQSNAPGMASLRNALLLNPPVITRNLSSACELLFQEPGFFILATELNINAACRNLRCDLRIFPLNNAPTVWSAYAFTPGSDLTEKFTDLVMQGLVQTERSRALAQVQGKASFCRSNRIAEQQEKANQLSPVLAILNVFWLYLAGIVFSCCVYMAEFLISRYRHRREEEFTEVY